MKLLSIDCIWDRADHNALTDLIYYQNTFFCCFREGEEHAGKRDGQIRILSSKDAKQWNSVALLSKDGIDLRDPKFSKMPDGRLMLNMGGSVYDDSKLITLSPHVAFSENGFEWSPPIDLEMEFEWIWQVSWNKGIGYGTSYSLSDFANRKAPWILKLFKTIDGIEYSFLKQFDIAKYPNETTLRFNQNDQMVALVRCHGNGFIGHAQPPYTEWNWFETKYELGGPNFIILPDGQMWAGSRLYKGEGKNKTTHTALYKMTLNSLEPALEFPSGGDCSYPGMTYHQEKLFISYYSSHVEKAKIYLAIVQL